MPDIAKRLRIVAKTNMEQGKLLSELALVGADELDRRGELLTHAWNGGEVQICEACSQWFRLEETISMDEGGWICKGCAGSAATDPDALTGCADDQDWVGVSADELRARAQALAEAGRQESPKDTALEESE